MGRRKVEPPCPNAANHTPAPTGYVAWHTWAEEMARTHRQRKCPDCQLWVIWVPSDAPEKP